MAKKKDIWRKGAELHHYWDDDCTIAITKHDSYEDAEEYAKFNDITNYDIYPIL